MSTALRTRQSAADRGRTEAALMGLAVPCTDKCLRMAEAYATARPIAFLLCLTPLESLIPDVLFVPNEIEVLDRLHVSQHPQEM